MVTASSSGSIIERLEYINNKVNNLYEVYGRGWVASSSGDASVALTQEACEDADWYWFEDGNGDGDYHDPEDGICASTTWFGNADSWNGVDCSTNDDNSYIADYTCTGSFPNGTVDTYSGYYTSGSCIVDGRAYTQGRCALCDADCQSRMPLGISDRPGVQIPLTEAIVNPSHANVAGAWGVPGDGAAGTPGASAVPDGPAPGGPIRS